MYQKYLVTGAKYPVGRLVVQMLLAEGCNVRVLVPPETDYSLLAGMGAEVYEGEIFNKDSLKAFLDVEDPRHSAVIHAEEILAISDKKNLDMRRINVAGTQNLVDMCIRAKIGRFAYLGSAYSLDPNKPVDGINVHFDRNKVEGDYATTKAEASAYIMEKISLNKFNATLLLPTFIIGPGFPADYDMNKIIKKYTESKVQTVAGGHAFVDVRDVASALVGICENGVTGGAYILNGEYKSSKEFFEDVAKTSGSGSVKELPKWAQSKSMAKLVDTFYRVSKKDNPKEVYALFMNNPSANFETNVDGLLDMDDIRKVHDSLEDAMKRPGSEVVPDRMPVKLGAKLAETEEKKEEVSEEKESAIKIPTLGALKKDEEEKPEEAEDVTPVEETKEETPVTSAETPAEEAKAEVAEEKTEEAPKLSVASILAEAAAKREAEKKAEEEAKAEEVAEEPTEETTEEVAAEESVEEAPAEVEAEAVTVEEAVVEESTEEEPETEEAVEAPAEEVAEAEETTEEAPVEETSEETTAEPAAKPIWETAPLSDDNLDEDEFFKDLM
ncbi:MAG: NAD-dependent epimerase/dehydratase family protein [Saccharofermentans sp.]|nr:NAD-dependent epimerase/dehydratase family protein [Saccharofermentans sp.]